ncbi:MAG: protein translocase subunit SecF [Acidimicrobiales bacterium]
MSPDAAGTKRANIWHRLYNGETDFRFVERRRRWFLFSALVILAGLLSLFTQGLNYGIDFKGGASWEVKAPGVSVAEARQALRSVGLSNAKIQVYGSDLLRVQGDQRPPEEQARVTAKLAELAKVETSQVSVNDVGPSWGSDVTKKARNALVVFFVLISAYISLRFEWKMAVAALAAVVHDILVTVGVYSISRFEVTPATVVAFLTILGYSLYDTIVVFDKVDENTKTLSGGRMTYSDAVDLSMNQVLMRSLNTSLVAILPILSILVIGAGILGATTLNDFGLALLVGLLTGAYSSIFVAAPILAMLKEREARYATLRQRVQAKGGGTGLLTPAAAAAARGGGTGAKTTSKKPDDAADASAGADGSLVEASASGSGTSRPRPANRPSSSPRPRKKGKRR